MFLGPADDEGRLPVLLISGFLGSGKTTLVNALLKTPRMAGTAVAINEFGQIPLDQHLIENGADATVVMANGCMCCYAGGDLEDAVMRVFSSQARGQLPGIRRLIVEPSGLADPAPIAQAILRNPVMSRALRLEGIITVVDAMFAEAQLARHPETRKQVSLADRLVIAKSDLLENRDGLPRLQALLGRLNPVAPIHVAPNGIMDAEILLPRRFIASNGAPSDYLFAETRLDAMAAGPSHGEPAFAVSLSATKPLRWRAFDAWLRTLRIENSERLLRIKGLVNVAGEDGPVVVHGVHHVLHQPVALADWPDADRRTRLVIIIQGLAAETIEASWRAALGGLYADPERMDACVP